MVCSSPIPLEERIFAIRRYRVILDRDLAELYGVKTKALNQAYRRNRGRFPEGFAFRLTAQELLSSVLRSPRAVRVNVRVIQAFVRMRRMAMMDRDIKDAISALQIKVGEHDESIQKMFAALNRLIETAPEPPPVIGFRRGE
jgi:hypothetical protein